MIIFRQGESESSEMFNLHSLVDVIKIYIQFILLTTFLPGQLFFYLVAKDGKNCLKSLKIILYMVKPTLVINSISSIAPIFGQSYNWFCSPAIPF